VYIHLVVEGVITLVLQVDSFIMFEAMLMCVAREAWTPTPKLRNLL